MDLIVVDGPNLFNATGSALKDVEESILKAYLLSWFDMDRFILSRTTRRRPRKRLREVDRFRQHTY